MNLQLTAGLALVFDMDGVIVDSNPAHRRAWELFNRQFGLETTEAMLERMYGKRNDEIVRDFFGAALSEAEVASRGAAKERLYREMIAANVEEMLVPGLKDFVKRHASVPMAVATNAEPANVDFILDRAGLRPCFRAVLDGSLVSNPKPHPEIYLRAADELGATPANCIVFEDSYSGVAAARAAGSRVVGIGTTHEDIPGADLTVADFRSGELEKWLASQRPIV